MATVNLTDEIYGNTAESFEGGFVCDNENLGKGLWGGLSIPHTVNLEFPTSDISISFWFKHVDTNDRVVVRKGSISEAAVIYADLSYDVGLLAYILYVYMGKMGGGGWESGCMVQISSLTEWNHIVVTGDSSGSDFISVYVNGIKQENYVLAPYTNLTISDLTVNAPIEIYALNRKDDTVGSLSSVNIKNDNEQSISFWMKTRGTPDDPWFYLENILNLSEDLTEVTFAASGTNALALPSDEAWHHYVFAFDLSSPNWSVYVDGALVDSFDDTFTIWFNGLLNVVGNASINTGILDFVAAPSTNNINGGLADIWIDEIQYYYRKLDATDVAALYNEATATTERTGCEAHYSFDDGTTWVDSSGNGHDITSAIKLSPGKFGKCMHIGLSRLELDEIQIYNRALSASEVLQLYGV